MKRVVTLVIGGAVACMSCISMERVPSADEIRKWSALEAFVVQPVFVTGIYENTDTDSVVFHYRTNVMAEGEFWRTLQKQAVSAGWQHVDRIASTHHRQYETFQRLKQKGELFFSSAEELRVAYTPTRVVVAYVQSDQIGHPEPVSQGSESRFADREIWPRFSQLVSDSGADWELVRSVRNPYGGTNDLVLIAERRKRDEAYYLEVAKAVCGERVQCVVNFWTDRAHIPTSASMPVADLAVMTAHYERHPDYEGPVLHLACWLYPNKEVAERAKCDYMPGAEIPWRK